MTIACVTASSTRVCNICWKLGQREGGIEGGGEERVMCMCNITLQGLLLLWLVLLKVHGDCWRLLVKWVMQKARLRNRVWGGGGGVVQYMGTSTGVQQCIIDTESSQVKVTAVNLHLNREVTKAVQNS